MAKGPACSVWRPFDKRKGNFVQKASFSTSASSTSNFADLNPGPDSFWIVAVEHGNTD
jgi:hypothetical protein